MRMVCIYDAYLTKSTKKGKKRLKVAIFSQKYAIF